MLVKHSDEFERQVLTYNTPGGKIHFAIGFGIANSIMIEGESANIIVDTSDSVYEAEQIYSLFKSKNDNPIEAIIYTHNHGDHTFGSAYYLKSQEKKPQIIAHEDTDFYVQRILGILNPIITKRSSRMFGTLLPEEDLINVGIGPSLSVSKSPAGYLKPDVTFKDSLITKIAGVDIELYHAPGETNDQIFIWLPVHEALMPGDNIYKTFPNLYTIRGTSHRDVIGWINSLDHMNSFGAEFLFPSHTKPIVGKNEIKDAVTLYRDGIQYTHDQTIRLMNEGLYPDQIVDMMCMALGGRAAEDLMFGKVTTGASDDLNRVTQMAYGMVRIYGMNESIGNVSFPPSEEMQFDKPYSDATAQMFDEEAKLIIQNAYKRTRDLLEDKKEALIAVAELLLEKETINQDDVIAAIGDRPFEMQENQKEFLRASFARFDQEEDKMKAAEKEKEDDDVVDDEVVDDEGETVEGDEELQRK